MALTPAQIVTLATDIQTHPELAEFYLGAANDNVAVRNYYNAPDPTLADCWRTSFSLNDALAVMNWTTFIARSQGERDAFRMMFMIGPVNPSLANIRNGFSDIFSGGTGTSMRAALAAAAKRKMTRAERLFALDGTGTFTLTFEGAIESVDVSAAFVLIPGA